MMGIKNKAKTREFESDSYDDYDEIDEDLDEFGDLSKDFNSADQRARSAYENRFSTRRKIERRNDLKELYAQFDDGDELDFGSEW